MSPAARARARARRGEGERLRDEIIAAAAELLAETDDESAVSIRAVAARVGVTAPTIYRHFADKDDLLFAVCSGVFTTLQRVLERAIAGTTDPLDGLRATLRTYVEFGLAHPEHYRLIFMRPPVLPAGVTIADFRAACAAGLPIASADGAIGHGLSGPELLGSEAFMVVFELVGRWLATLADVDDVDERPDQFTVATSLWAHAHGVASLRIAKPDFSWPSLDEQLAAVIWPLVALTAR